MSSTWLGCVKSFYPDYDDMVKVLEQGPKIVVNINYATGPNYILSIEEVWADDTIPYDHNGRIEDVICWATKILKANPGCNRAAWNMWNFHNRQSAEKFQVALLLKWS